MEREKLCPIAISLHFQGDALERIELCHADRFTLSLPETCPEKNSVAGWFASYLNGLHLPFPLRLSYHTSPFAETVLRELRQIPFGATSTYHKLATRLGNPRAARAVGNACGKNPLPLVIPCHRITKSNGQPGGFAFGEPIKRTLLKFESQF